VSAADLVQRVIANEPRAVARALRLVDDRMPGTHELLRALWPHTGRATVIGVTGNPGAGKSTLCDRMIGLYRARGDRVGVIAVDPSSPLSGGAILGDRLRMSSHALDEGVFIRSLATRGELGGLSRTSRDAIRVLDASGHAVVIVETVGVGQDEIEIASTAHSTLVVTTPGLGDEVQALKAGLLECADVFAVNKADREGADAAIRDLELMISLGDASVLALSRQNGSGWSVPIIRCVATRTEGVAEVVAALDRHRQWLDTHPAGLARRRKRLEQEVRSSLRDELVDTAMRDLGPHLNAAVDDIEARRVDPYEATSNLIMRFMRAGS
jgi:LAO/AO transport system kinase